MFAFEDDLEAKQWVLDTQKARRSLTAWELGQIALKLKPEIEARAAENKGARTDLRTTLSEGFETIDTKQELADATGLSRGTVNKVIQIDERAPESVKAAMDDGLSVNAGYNITRLLEKLPEEVRAAAVQRAIALAKERKGYKAAFDLSIDDMNALVKEDDDAAGAIRAALFEGGLSVNGGEVVAMSLLGMPEDVRESAAEDAEGLAEIEADYRRGIAKADEHGRIAKAYCAAFEKAVDVHGTDYEVRTWVEFAGIRKPEYTGLIAEAEDVAQRFTRVAEILKQIYETEVVPYEHLYQDSEGQGEG